MLLFSHASSGVASPEVLGWLFFRFGLARRCKPQASTVSLGSLSGVRQGVPVGRGHGSSFGPCFVPGSVPDASVRV